MPTVRKLSIDEAAALALEFVRSSCGSADIKSAAQASGIGTLLFQPRKKARVWEELFCVSAAMAANAISFSNSDRVSKTMSKTVFEVQTLRQLKHLLGPENEVASSRFHEKIRTYLAELDGGVAAIGISSTFIANLVGNKASTDPGAALQMIPILGSMQMAMREGMSSVQIVRDENDE